MQPASMTASLVTITCSLPQEQGPLSLALSIIMIFSSISKRCKTQVDCAEKRALNRGGGTVSDEVTVLL